MLPRQGPLGHRERRKPSTPAASNSPSQPEPEAGSPTTGEPGRGGAAAGTGQGAAAARAAVAAAAACRGPQAQLELQSNPFAPPCRGGDQIVTPPAARAHGGSGTRHSHPPML